MKHILVIDDERDILACLDEALTGEGYRVTAAVSGIEALDLVATDPPDLVMLDLRMPHMNGIEVLQAIRRSHPKMPIVVCSALTSYKSDFDIIQSNVSAFIEKPMDFNKVIKTVRILIGDGDTSAATLPPDQAHE